MTEDTPISIAEQSYSPIRTSAQTDQIDAAMAAAQAELENPIKSKTANLEGVSKTSGKEYKIGYAYADIADILADCRPVLAKQGIAIYQVPVIAPGAALLIVTRLAKSGQWIEGDYPVCKIGADHQDMGKAMTYARRYALGAMIGIAPEKDTDGVGAAPSYAQDRPARPAPAKAAFNKTANTVLETFIAGMKMNKTVETVDAWASREANSIMEKLNRREQDDMQDAYGAWRNELAARDDTPQGTPFDDNLEAMNA